MSNQETAVADAYGYLQDAINQKSVHLQTYGQLGFVSLTFKYLVYQKQLLVAKPSYDLGLRVLHSVRKI